MKTEVKEFCKLHNLTEDQFYGKEKIEGSLDLSSLTSIPAGFNPTVGGSLKELRLKIYCQFWKPMMLMV